MKIHINLILVLLISSVIDLYAQNITASQLDFLKKNAVDLNIDKASSDYGWNDTASKIGGKKFVLIGEFNHGSREVFLLRNEFIQYLHKKLGYEVILFEAGIGELIYLDLNKQSLSPNQMTAGFFSGWRTKEFRALMEYVKEEGLSVSGFDVQRTGRSFEKLLIELSIIAQTDSLEYIRMEKEFGELKRGLPNRKIEYTDSIQLKTEELINDYEKAHAQLLNSTVQLPLKESMFVLKTFENRIGYLDYMLEFKKFKNWNKRWAARDSLMAENIIWLSEKIYRDQKIIIVGHNYHISKYNEKEAVMGRFLNKRYPNEMYSIGVYARSGQYLGNYGDVKELSVADSNKLDIKHIIAKLDHETSFINIPDGLEGGSEWLHSPIITNDTFIDLSNSNSLILSKAYDGLFLLKEISIPQN